MSGILPKFADFELDRSAYQLRRKGRPVMLERIPLDLLFLLAERQGTLVTREEILARIWGKNVFLDVDSAINTAVRKIRRALNDNAESPRFIETVPAKGYRFLAPVREVASAEQESTTSRGQKIPMVGRERELSLLRAALDEAAVGSRRLVLISGEAGIGKTRLADEVLTIARAKRMAVLTGRCLDDEQAVPFLPFVEMLENIVDHSSDPDALQITFGEQGGELSRLLPRLSTLVPDFTARSDLGPAESRRHLFNSFCDFVARIARQRSALLLLEDLHWADDSTLALLDHLIQRVRELPVLVIGTYRDELELTGGLAKHLEKLLRDRLTTRLVLKRLQPDEVATMLQALSRRESPADLAEILFAESEGNPFLVEELFRYLEEEGRLYDNEGNFRERLAVGERDAPPSVRLIVTRRLERLSPGTRQILATAAVIGRSFDFDLLRISVEGDPDGVLTGVEEAEKAGLISLIAEGPNLRFEFSHELTRQAVIAGLSGGRLQMLHLRVAETIARMPAIEDHLAELAQHYRRGGDRAAAVDYLQRAGTHDVDRAMYAEAETYFAAALDELQAMPASTRRDVLELRVRSSFGQAMAARRGYGAREVFEMVSRARTLAEKTGNLAELVQQLWIQVGFPETRGELIAAAKSIDLLLATAEREGNPVSLAMAHTMQLENHFFRGDFSGCEQHYARGRPFFESPGFMKVQYGPAAAFGMSSWNAWMLGRADLARERLRQAYERTEQDVFDTALLGQMAAVLHLLLGEFAEAEKVAADALTYSEQHGFPELAMWHRTPLAVAWAKRGRAAEAVDLLRRVGDEMRSKGTFITITHHLTWLAETEGLAGAVDKALETAEAALEASREELYFHPETYRIRGELRLMQGDRASAEADFREAIAIAQKMDARSWELRAATSLARLLRKVRRRDDARATLGNIYNWFTEGFDTADLRDAKALLDELNK